MPTRSIRRSTFVAAVTGALLMVGPAALADIPPDPAAWIMARGETIDWQSSSDMWWRSATVVADGPLAGRPGNRHTATVHAGWAATGPRPGPPALAVTLDLREEDCPAGGGECRTLWAGTGSLPYSSVIPEPAADGSVRVQATVPASVFTTTEPAGATVPIGDTQLDVVLTPVNWQDPRVPDTETSDGATRYASTDGYDTVSVNNERQGTGIAATGVVAGVPAQRVTGGDWHDRGGASGSAGPGLPPVSTLAETRPYLPTVRDGRVNRQSYAAAFWDGQLAGSAPLRTSTGHRLPGNTWRAGLYSQINLSQGDRVEGTTTYGVNLGLEGRQCAAGQAWEECAPVTMPSIGEPSVVRYRIRFGAAVEYRFTSPVFQYLEDGTRQDLGTLDTRASIRPEGSGAGYWFGWLVREAQQTWQFTATVRFGATASMTVAGRPASGPGNPGNRWIEFATIGEGTL